MRVADRLKISHMMMAMKKMMKAANNKQTPIYFKRFELMIGPQPGISSLSYGMDMRNKKKVPVTANIKSNLMAVLIKTLLLETRLKN